MYKHSLAVLCVATVALSGVVAPAATAAEDNGCKPGMISGDFNWGVSKEFTDYLGRYRTLDGFTLKYNEGDVCPPLKPAPPAPPVDPGNPGQPGDPGDTTPPPADQTPDNGSSGSSAGIGFFGALAGLGIIGAIIAFFLNNHQGANPIQQLLAGLPFGRR